MHHGLAQSVQGLAGHPQLQAAAAAAEHRLFARVPTDAMM